MNKNYIIEPAVGFRVWSYQPDNIYSGKMFYDKWITADGEVIGVKEPYITMYYTGIKFRNIKIYEKDVIKALIGLNGNRNQKTVIAIVNLCYLVVIGFAKEVKQGKWKFVKGNAGLKDIPLEKIMRIKRYYGNVFENPEILNLREVE